jgi:hypothetical protein
VSVVFVAGCLGVLARAQDSTQCTPPSFRVGQDYGASLFVSIQPRDLVLSKLICLAQILRNRRGDRTNFGVLFFDSAEAAKYFLPPVEGYPPRWPQWAKRLHAIYSMDADKHEESLGILPMGFNTAPSLLTEIDLPLAGVPHCGLELLTHCVIAALEKIEFPRESLKVGAAGTITLTGTVARDGRVTGLRVAAVDAVPVGEKRRLANAALQDLKTWQFDAARQASSIRVIYSFAVDTSLILGGVPEVQWALPNQVKVRMSLPR